MATQDVPGANPANADALAPGGWAEHEDGSLIFVKGTENGQVVFEIYDVSQEPVVYYQDAMRESDFKEAFSFPPVGSSPEKWTWHDKTTFPWDRVIKRFEGRPPAPQHADVEEQLSAAARVAESLKLRGQDFKEKHAEHMTDRDLPKAAGIVGRIKKVLDVLVGGRE